MARASCTSSCSRSRRCSAFSTCLVSLLALLCANLSLAAARSLVELDINCQVGCSKHFQPVCGTDGQTYSNKCYAKCQEVEVLSKAGPCPEESLLHSSNLANLVQEPSTLVNIKHMAAFKSEGFKYTGQLKFNQRPMTRKAPVIPADGASPPSSSQKASSKQQHQPDSPMRALRITRQGHVYVAEMDEGIEKGLASLARFQNRTQQNNSSQGGLHPREIPSATAAAFPHSGSAQAQHTSNSDPTSTTTTTSQHARRMLGIFDTDDRLPCPATSTYPFTATGQINVKDDKGSYVCSGVLVGPDVVLTAAHCVYSRTNQAFYDKLDFAPGRIRTASGEIINPFGVIPWSYVTVYQGYSSLVTPDPNVWDIAVIKLSSKVGNTAGWMGVYEPCGDLAPTRYIATTAGYPSDKPSGSCVMTQCVVKQEPCTDPYLYHKCDTASGQSGSPMWMLAITSSHKMGPYIRAVHNIEWVQAGANGQQQSYINSAVSITPDHYRSILAWIAPAFEADADTVVASAPMSPAPPPKAPS